jgi:membrane-bound lytic murein transglycosylase B
LESRRTFLKNLLPRLFLVSGILSLRPARRALGHVASRTRGPDLSDPRYVNLIKELSSRYKFSPEDLRAVFKKAVLRPEIIEKFEHPPEKVLPYYEYRRLFLKEDLIAQARSYLNENHSLFEKVEENFGVEKEVICSILGIESRFGQAGIQGFRVFDVLNTAFSDYPRRERFFRNELVEFLLLCREERVDPLEIMGSYAGAFGAPQFMPSSFRQYAVDYDQDGRRDIIDSKGDILASIANYLRSFGWRHNGPLQRRATLVRDSAEVKRIIGGGLRSTAPVASLLDMGVKIDPVPDGNEEASLVMYQPKEGEGDNLLAVFENFRAIAHYNFSNNYVLTVVELSELLEKG